MSHRAIPEQVSLFHAADGDHEDAHSTSELEGMKRVLEESGRYVVLRRLHPSDTYLEPSPDAAGSLRRGVYLDVETTGLNANDKIIELALVSFEYDDAGSVYRVLERFDEFEDPGSPIPREITDLTGITSADVRGKRIQDERVNALVGSADLVIAHNAAFDRPFVERRLPVFESLDWACSVSDVDWHRFGFRGRKLEYLAMERGFVYESHRAISDCEAGLEILALPLSGQQPPPLANLLSNANRTSVRLWAVGSPFDSKDLLKSRSYRWNAGAKTWWRDVASDEHEAELEWLLANVYGRPMRLPYHPITATLRYSTRIPDAPPPGAPTL